MDREREGSGRRHMGYSMKLGQLVCYFEFCWRLFKIHSAVFPIPIHREIHILVSHFMPNSSNKIFSSFFHNNHFFTRFQCSKLLSQIEREETHLLVLRVMVGLVILYDHVHPVGAFVRGSHIDVKGCIRLLQAQPAVKAEPLLNALRYTTKHLNEENTPKNIRNLLAA